MTTSKLTPRTAMNCGVADAEMLEEGKTQKLTYIKRSLTLTLA
jgi:hypothetical protein